jgi:type VI secretion system secreted protein VgrG
MPSDRVSLRSAELPETVRVRSLHGHEAMNELSAWEVELFTEEPIDEERVLRAPVTLRLTDEGEGTERALGLVVTEVIADGESRDGFRFSLGLASPAWVLTQRSGYRVFVDKTIQEIVQSVLRDAGFGDSSHVWRLTGKYLRRLQCVQYAESEWAFVTRLLAEEGIAFWHDFDDEQGPRMVFGDAPGSHEGIQAPTAVPFDDAKGMVAARHFFALEVRQRVAPDAVHLRDLDVRQPDRFIEGIAGEGPLEVFEYPARVLTTDAAVERAKVRLEQLQRDAREAVGEGDCIRIQPGRLLEIEGCSDDEGNGRYLVTSVEHDVQEASAHTDTARAYRSLVRMVPRSYRPAEPRMAPRVSGLESAITTGAAGEEIHVDDLGRVKVRFPWDRSGIGDDRSSAWVRCLQLGMGGSMLLPRVGWEVPVGYLHGDPDRPIVLGRTYNASAVVPYALPGASATTTLQSATSPGGGSTNEVRMGDGKGGQEMFVHASRDQSVSVGGAAITQIGANETHDVGLSHGVGIGGSQSHSVGGSQSVNVGTDHALGVKGGRSESVGGSETIDVTANRGVSTGSYSEMIGAMYGLRCNQSNTSVSGAFVELVGAAMSLTAGLGTSESVAAARTELVGGVRSILAGKYVENVTGAKVVTAGPASDKAGAKVVTETKAVGSIKAASFKSTAGGPVVVSAPAITLQVGGSLTAGALNLAGGTLKATKGATKLKGTIKRQGESKIE